jgi:hypothetical protein
MKTVVRKSILAGILAFTTAIATVPAHATVAGSSPRPVLNSVVLFLATVQSLFVY